MHCHSSLSRTGNTLYDHVHLWRSADHFVLFFLDRSDNHTQYSALISGKIFGQELIIRYHIGIIEIKETVLRNFVGAFAFQVDLTVPLVLHSVTAASHCIFIIDRGHRSTPVYNCRVRTVFRNTDAPHIVGFCKWKFRIPEINPAEIRLLTRFSAPDEISLVFPQLGLGIVEE